MNPDPTSLERLHDIVVPPPAPWWPPAAGWYIVLGVLAWLAIVGLIRAARFWQQNRYRREALHQLALLKNALHHQEGRADTLAAIATLLKRAALSAWQREQVASLTGQQWWRFLDTSGGTTRFSDGLGNLMERAAYDPQSAALVDEQQLTELFTAAGHWLAHHHTEARPC